MKRLSLVMLLALTAVGCGDGDGRSDEEAVSAVVMDYLSAQRALDGEAGCAALTEEGARMIWGDDTIDVGGCPAAFEREVQDADIPPPTELRVSEVWVKGDEAEALVAAVDTRFALRRIDGEWKIDVLIGLVGD
jgi:hypothetical protein